MLVRLFILGMLLVAGLGAEEKAPNRASQILTAALAQKLLGQPVQPADANFQADTVRGPVWVSNAYYSVAGAPPPAPFVALLVRHGGTEAEAKQGFYGSKKMYQGQDVAGLGVPAYRTSQPAQLHLLRGRKWLIVSCGTFQKPDLSGQEAAARAVLAQCKE